MHSVNCGAKPNMTAETKIHAERNNNATHLVRVKEVVEIVSLLQGSVEVVRTWIRLQMRHKSNTSTSSSMTKHDKPNNNTPAHGCCAN